MVGTLDQTAITPDPAEIPFVLRKNYFPNEGISPELADIKGKLCPDGALVLNNFPSGKEDLVYLYPEQVKQLVSFLEEMTG